jgi:histidine triad (HIT) family protein
MSQETKCLFCRISSGHLNADIVAKSDSAVAFKDIHPKAPIHVLVVPKEHISSLAEIGEEDKNLMGELMVLVGQVAKDLGLSDEGYRVIINTRHHGGQEVDHLHIHILGGEPIGPMRGK